jgi:hypothetical protein
MRLKPAVLILCFLLCVSLSFSHDTGYAYKSWKKHYIKSLKILNKDPDKFLDMYIRERICETKGFISNVQGYLEMPSFAEKYGQASDPETAEARKALQEILGRHVTQKICGPQIEKSERFDAVTKHKEPIYINSFKEIAYSQWCTNLGDFTSDRDDCLMTSFVIPGLRKFTLLVTSYSLDDFDNIKLMPAKIYDVMLEKEVDTWKIICFCPKNTQKIQQTRMNVYSYEAFAYLSEIGRQKGFLERVHREEPGVAGLVRAVELKYGVR